MGESWFVRITEFRDRMGELNQEINWGPDNVKDGQVGKAHSNARDRSISRDRYSRGLSVGARGSGWWRRLVLLLVARDRQEMARR